MNWSRGIVIALTLIVVSATGMAGQDIDEVSVKEFNAEYTAPEVVKSVRPERVFYNSNREIEGYISLELTVDTKGKVESAKVLYKTSQLAVNSAINAVSKWEFKPATMNGMPVRSTIAYSLPFGRDLEVLVVEDHDPKVILDETTVALLQE